MKNEKKQVIQTIRKERGETMEGKLTTKRERFLSNVANAIRQLPSISTEEDTTVDNIILMDLIRLKNSASSGSVSYLEDCESGEGYIVLENPTASAHSLN